MPFIRKKGAGMGRIHTEKRVIDAGGRSMNCLVLRPAARAKEKPPGILWIHGGGYITGMAGMVYISRALPLVRKYGAIVLSPEYRLAREAPYPAALKDCYAALLYLKDHAGEFGIDTGRLMVGGESAGGGLAVAVCLEARRRGEVNIAFQMPLSGVDVPASAAPARETDYTGLPPAYTFVGKREPFYCETISYIEHLKAAGVEASCDVYESGMHAFDMLTPFRKISRQAACAFERQYRYAAEHYRVRQ